MQSKRNIAAIVLLSLTIQARPKQTMASQISDTDDSADTWVSKLLLNLLDRKSKMGPFPSEDFDDTTTGKCRRLKLFPETQYKLHMRLVTSHSPNFQVTQVHINAGRPRHRCQIDHLAKTARRYDHILLGCCAGVNTPDSQYQCEKRGMYHPGKIALVLERVFSLSNLVNIVRTATAFDVSEVIICGLTLNPRGIRLVNKSFIPAHEALHKLRELSGRAAASIRIRDFASSQDCLTFLNKEGYQSLAMSPHPPALTWYPPQSEHDVKSTKIGFVGNLAVWLGNEEEGLSAETLDNICTRIAIPMKGLDSLNVAEATSAVLVELKRCKLMHVNSELMLWRYNTTKTAFLPKLNTPYPVKYDFFRLRRRTDLVGHPRKWKHKMTALEKAVDHMQTGFIVVLVSPSREGLRTIRSMSAFGISELHIVSGDADTLQIAPSYALAHKRFGKRYVLIRNFSNIAESMQELTERDFTTVMPCLSNSTSAVSIFDANLGALQNIALVFANGDDRQTLEPTVDYQVSLPMIPGGSVSDQGFATMFLSEITRQRAEAQHINRFNAAAGEKELLFKHLLCQNYGVC